MASVQPSVILLLLSLLLLLSGVYAATFTIINQCSYTVWPGILSNAGTQQLPTTGFILQPGQSNAFYVPTSWSGRLWGRTLCAQDSTGKFSCVTGDCGASTVECAGAGAQPPATLAEFTLNGAGGLDFYDVSLVDGYNLPMTVVPHGGTGGNCTTTGCVPDLNRACPTQLKVMSGGDGSESVACKSACEAFGDPQYCCSGAYATPDTCKPSSYSEFFKTACPRAYSYAYDDGTSTFTCASADYVITFCPSASASVKSTNGQFPSAVQVSTGTPEAPANLIGRQRPPAPDDRKRDTTPELPQSVSCRPPGSGRESRGSIGGHSAEEIVSKGEEKNGIHRRSFQVLQN
ncbi:Thaumatin-like protein 1 [Morella rubra]|uniref:Thaumatin-like protein 1 n=1 Tax=Morella rubra TaxID=262757 RepID=A0A6A1UGN7_9ROSI|nr:Thaumatin-like protein 1 [Morella rubra]